MTNRKSAVLRPIGSVRPGWAAHAPTRRQALLIIRNDTEMKSCQSNKIRELGAALVREGFLTLDEQAEVLGLCRSTTWTILQANHKASGLSASVINRMLASPALPPSARATIIEYVQEKIAGRYGHGQKQIRRFSASLSIEPRRASRAA